MFFVSPSFVTVARPANLCTYIILYVINVHVYRIPPSVQVNGVNADCMGYFRMREKKTQTLNMSTNGLLYLIFLPTSLFECASRRSLIYASF